MPRRASIRPVVLAAALAGCAGEADRPAAADSVAAAARADAADSIVAVTDSAATAHGELRVREVLYVRDHVRTHTLLVDRRPLLRSELTLEMAIDTVWEGPEFAPDASVALVRVSPGGNACMWLYRIATLRAGRPPAVTDELGTCNPPDSTWTAGGALRMRFPPWVTYAMERDGVPPGPAATWIYREGRIEKEAP